MHENLSAVSARHSFLRRFTNFLFFTGWLCPAVIFFGCRNPCFFFFQFHKGIIQNQPFSLGEHCKIKPALKVADKGVLPMICRIRSISIRDVIRFKARLQSSF